MSLLDELAESLQTVSDGLAEEIRARYPSRMEYSIELTRYNRDMKSVLQARNLLSDYAAQRAPQPKPDLTC